MTHRTWMGALAVVAAVGVVAASATTLAQPASPGKVVPKEKDKNPTGPKRSGATQVGTIAPEWTAKDPEGKEHKLSDYKGKLVLMDFWGTWCPPCRAAMPGMQKLHEKYKDQGLVVLGMNVERSANADPAGYMKQNKYTYGLMLNSEEIARQYSIMAYPTFILIGPDGKILFRDQGFSQNVERQLEETIKANLDKVQPDAKSPDKKPDQKDEGKPTDKQPETPAKPGTDAKPGKR